MEKIAKNRKKYSCQCCDYITSNKFDYTKHINTEKHQNTIESTKINSLSTDLSQKSQKNTYCCECGSLYKDRSGLWRHRKVCDIYKQTKKTYSQPESTEQIKVFAEVVKTVVTEVMKHGGNTHNENNNIENHNHSHNKTFNLNFYLNETCKDAIDISNFVKNIKVRLEDLENTGRQGYVEGVTNIIRKNLNSITTHSRPIHCTDEKREVLYIKNDGEWIKETEHKPILTNAIKTIANENIKQISEWTKLYPDCRESESMKNDLYLKIVSNAMSGGTKEECEKNYNKIIKNIVKQTVVNK